MKTKVTVSVLLACLICWGLAWAGPVMITPDGLIFADNSTQTTAATGTGDGHSLGTPDGSAVDVVVVDNNAYVGIGTLQPMRKLHLADVMRLQPLTAGPADPGQGDLYFDASDALCAYLTTGWLNIAGEGACGANVNTLTFSGAAQGAEEVVTVLYGQVTRDDATPSALQPRIMDLTFIWPDALLSYVSVASGQAVIDAEKGVTAIITPLDDPAGWTKGRFILFSAANTNRIGPGDLLHITFEVNASGLASLQWDQTHTGFAPVETQEILTTEDLDVTVVAVP